MIKHVLFAVLLFVILGCSSSPNEKKPDTVNDKEHSNHVTLSHVRAYLLLGNIQKAEQLFQNIYSTDLNGQSQLLLAELHAAKGNSIEAQKVFLSALTNLQFELAQDKASIPEALLDYFCEEEKWPALKGYGASIISTANDETESLTHYTDIKNDALTKIGLCFYYQQRWGDTQYWLEKLDKTKQIKPIIYLALARAKIEQQQFSDAQGFMTQYEQNKDTVDPQSLWIAIEVYLGLNQPEMVTQVGENMRSLFPHNDYTRKYILLTKRRRTQDIAKKLSPSLTLSSSLPLALEPKDDINAFHIMKKGETLYQLSKRYGVTIPELQLWNPSLVIDNISVGTKIRLTRGQ